MASTTTNHPFLIYNASAGSGKTHTLTKEYIKALITAKSPTKYRNILAITFTNKAVSEMKARIVKKLVDFANHQSHEDDDMWTDVLKETGLQPEELQKRSQNILRYLIHDYAGFDLQTIDGFTHKLIRTFAHDLKLPMNFEVTLDIDLLLAQAVDRLLAKAGSDEQLTQTLVDFALDKADDDKSWDIQRDLNTTSKLLTKEDEIKYVELLRQKNLSDFNQLKKILGQEKATLKNEIVQTAKQVLELISESGLEFKDFSRGSVPGYFEKLANNDLNPKFGAQWQEKLINGEELYNKGLHDDLKATIDSIQPTLADAFTKTKKGMSRLKFLDNFYLNITPLSVLKAIYEEVKTIKDEEGLLPISEFNQIISNEIKNQPAPFIYERLGEKYHHYFIDEFQDTSTLQWHNLIPLVDNALSSNEKNNVLLVGDPKQAIYRWRGGDPEQFIGLINGETPFSRANAHIQNLPTNFRSNQTIVDFCNSLFTHAKSIFLNQDHTYIYKVGNEQRSNNPEEGYVNIQFLEKNDDEKVAEQYANSVIQTIQDLQQKNVPLGDICILVRKNKQGVALAEALSEVGIDVVSSESLLLKNNPKVQFINNLIKLAYQPENAELKINILSFLANHLLNIDNEYLFYKTHLNKIPQDLFAGLKEFDIHFNFNEFINRNLYEAAELVIDVFALSKNADAYIQFYLDVVYEYLQRNQAGFAGFISYWEKKENSLSIVSTKSEHAVQIMSVHKSKGLAFPIVIYPHVDDTIIDHKKDMAWVPIDQDTYGFEYAHVKVNDDLNNLNETASQILQLKKEQNQLDAINILYVALTRAEHQIFIISQKPSTKNFNASKTYSTLLVSFLMERQAWNDGQLIYEFGNADAALPQTKDDKSKKPSYLFEFNARDTKNLNILTKSGLLWNTKQASAIEKGNIIHNILSFVTYSEDVEAAVQKAIDQGMITTDEKQEVLQSLISITEHEELSNYYNKTYTIYNERDIISETGMLLRPDRVCIDANNHAILIDYKTGAIHKEHKQQLVGYEDILKEMGFTVTTKLLVYINDTINIVAA
ncbi:UvrD-helicase domain-containing protein [Spongiivirga citrea]|uniref:DNA 3'-5' helicase n=1 Tax=Spongiivirga citrea TaxID=1481457 RepID=A0A6M0CH17_9FLAO|nr:UvrD-helicase domain-containing protein [Spongiivirga citrea]NER17218.1 UvrD-helicase domain-containing protein [Spongiivirga citrea]